MRNILSISSGLPSGFSVIRSVRAQLDLKKCNANELESAVLLDALHFMHVALFDDEGNDIGHLDEGEPGFYRWNIAKQFFEHYFVMLGGSALDVADLYVGRCVALSENTKGGIRYSDLFATVEGTYKI